MTNPINNSYPEAQRIRNRIQDAKTLVSSTVRDNLFDSIHNELAELDGAKTRNLLTAEISKAEAMALWGLGR